jgi:DNA-binding transcriptional regulator of glucitol operon
MEILFLFFITLVIIQWFFKTKQSKVMHSHYNKFLESGNVLVERSKGLFSGAIVMFQIDQEANVKDCLLLSGATFFSSWRNCDELINKNLLLLKQEDLINYKKTEKRVIMKAIQTFENSKAEKI